MTPIRTARIARLPLLAHLAFCTITAALAVPAAAAPGGSPVTLGLPLYDPVHGATSLPAYRADRFLLRISSDAVSPDVSGSAARGRLGHAALDAILARFAVTRLERVFPAALPPEPGSGLEDLTEFYAVYLPRGASLVEALAAFRGAPGIESAEPIGVYELSRTPNDSLFAGQWPLEIENDHDSDFPEAWEITIGDTAEVIAIIDSGVLWTHPDLGGPPPFTGGNIWHNWVEMGGVEGVDDDVNGYIDDVRGWDFVTGENGLAGEDDDIPDNDPSDFNGHGTLVAGLAGAITDNVSGIAGAGWRCKVMALRVGWTDAVSGAGLVDMMYCAQAIEYATRKGVKVINCSWTSGNEGGIAAAVTNAVALGVSVVVAAGNQNQQTPPKNYLATRGDCVDVGSIDINDRKSFFSNYGPWIDVCAGGDGVRSTFSSSYQPTYSSSAGTSFSAPHVAGAIALYRSHRRAQGLPPATPFEILLRVRDTADNIDHLNTEFAGKLGGGRLNAHQMLAAPPTSFRARVSGAVTTAPAFVDWGGPAMAIVGGTLEGNVFAIGPTGETFHHWPISLGSAIFSHPAVWDLDFDGSPDVVIGDSDGQLHALNKNGNPVDGWPVTLGGAVWAGPAIGDVAGDAAYEIVVATTAPDALHVLDRLGNELPGWPRPLGASAESGPALGDLDGDDKAEIVIGGLDSLLHVFRGDGNELSPSWPINVGGAIYASPSLGDVDGDGQLDIVVGSTAGGVHAIRAAGTSLAGFPAIGGGWVESQPALANLDSDPQLEMAYGTENGAVIVRDHDGSFVDGWGEQTGGVIRGTVLLGDLDEDGGLDVIAASGDGSVYAWHLDGEPLVGFPRPSGAPLLAAATLGDPDRDGRLELVFGNQNQQVWAWDYGPGSYDPARIAWGTIGRTFLRDGSTLLPSIGVPPPAANIAGLSLTPNPGRGRTIASVRFAAAAGAEVRFAVYDAAGRERRAHRQTLDGAGGASWTVEAAGGLGPGLYFVRATCGAESFTAKWVHLR